MFQRKTIKLNQKFKPLKFTFNYRKLCLMKQKNISGMNK